MESSSGDEHNSESGNAAAPDASPRSNPAGRAQRIRGQLFNPSILPFSSDADQTPFLPNPRTSVEPDEHDTTVEGDVGYDGSLDREGPPGTLKPVLQDRKINEDLRARYFDLQIELKRIRDKLHQSGQLPILPASEETRTIDETGPHYHVKKQAVHESQQSGLQEELALLKSQNEGLSRHIEELEESEASLRRENIILTAEIAEGGSEINRLRNELQAACNSTTDVNLKSLRTELDVARGELAHARARENALRKENEHFQVQLSRVQTTRIDKRRAAELSTAAEELEDLSTRLSRALKQKSQISAMFEEQLALNEEQSRLLNEAQVELLNFNSHVSELDSRLGDRVSYAARLEADLTRSEQEIGSLGEKLKNADEKEKSLSGELFGLQQQHASQESALNDAREHLKALEQRLLQQENEKMQVVNENASLSEALQGKSEQVMKLTADLTEATAKREEIEKRVQFLSTSLEQASGENTESYKLIGSLRSELLEREREFDAQTAENARLVGSVTELNTKIKDLERALEDSISENASNAEKLQSTIDRLKRQIEDNEESYRTQESELRSKNAINTAQSRGKHEEELKRVRAEKSQREYQLLGEISKLEAEIVDLKDARATIEADRDALSIRERKAEQRIKGLDASLREAALGLTEAEEKARKAMSEARDYRAQYEKRKISEEALADKIKTLEETVSNQAIRLNDLNVGDISSLRSQAQEGAAAINEFMKLRQEFAARQSDWMTAHNELSLNIQRLAEANKRLEEELMAYRSSDTEREQKFRSAIYATHQGEIQRLQADYQFNYNLLSESMKSLELERDNFKKQVLEQKASMQELEFNANIIQQDLAQTKSTADRWESELSAVHEQCVHLEAQNADLKAQVNELMRKVQRSDQLVHSKESTLLELQVQLRDLQTKLKAEADEKADYESRWYSGQKFYNEILERMQVIFFAYSYQVESLMFIKRIFTKRFPRIDVIGSNGLLSAPKSKRRTFQEAAMFALALVRFKSAAREGKVRKARENSEFLSSRLPQ